MNYSRRYWVRLGGQAVARGSITVLLTIAVVASQTAINEATPAAGRELAATLTLVDLGTTQITVLDPFFLALVAWAAVPVARLVTPLVVDMAADVGVIDR